MVRPCVKDCDRVSVDWGEQRFCANAVPVGMCSALIRSVVLQWSGQTLVLAAASVDY